MIFEPHEYQTYAICRIIDTPRLALFLDCGLGKTVVTLSAIKELECMMWSVSKVLIIAPKKVAEATWQQEISKWSHLHGLTVSTVLGSAQQRLRALSAPAGIYIINRDNVPWIVDHYRQDWPFDMVVLDESSSFKNHRSKRWKALKLELPRISRLVELTGTPAPNGLIDLWAQIYLLDQGHRLGRTLTQYRDIYFDPDQRSRMQIFSYKPKDGAADRIQAAISDIAVSMKAEDYLQLPEYVEDIVPVVLDAPAQKAYDKLERDALLEVDQDTITAGTAAVLTNKLLQLCDGAVYDNEHKVTPIHDCKIEAFLEIVEQLHGEHALVFYNFKHDKDRIISALAESGLRVRAYESAADEADWNAGQIDILLAHPASCAYGLNLQDGGHHIVWFGLTWSLEQYQQANKRLHRQGQRYPVIVHHLVVQDGVDADVMRALQSKGDTQESLMQALKVRIAKARMED